MYAFYPQFLYTCEDDNITLIIFQELKFLMRTLKIFHF